MYVVELTENFGTQSYHTKKFQWTSSTLSVLLPLVLTVELWRKALYSTGHETSIK